MKKEAFLINFDDGLRIVCTLILSALYWYVLQNLHTTLF